MKSRLFAEVRAELPDDSKWNEEGDLLRPRGENVANILGSALEKAGVTSSDVCQHKFYGWSFTATSRNASYVIVVQFPDNDGLIEMQTSVPVYRWIQGVRVADAEAALRDSIDAVAKEDGRFYIS